MRAHGRPGSRICASGGHRWRRAGDLACAHGCHAPARAGAPRTRRCAPGRAACSARVWTASQSWKPTSTCTTRAAPAAHLPALAHAARDRHGHRVGLHPGAGAGRAAGPAGTSIIRVLGSGIPEGPGWDVQFKRMQRGLGAAMARLKVYVEKQMGAVPERREPRTRARSPALRGGQNDRLHLPCGDRRARPVAGHALGERHLYRQPRPRWCSRALLLGVVNAVVRPIAVILTFPFTILTLGLFLLVVNAAMLGLVALLLPGFTSTASGPPCSPRSSSASRAGSARCSSARNAKVEVYSRKG